MFSAIVKYICMAALVLESSLRLGGIAVILLQLVVCGGAAFVMMQAARSRKRLWAAGFAVIALYFNPVLPIALPRPASITMALLCLVAFLGAAVYLKPVPRMSLATITDLPPRGESL
jgi:hypothetical protein